MSTVSQEELITSWCSTAISTNKFTIEKLKGDASQRIYYRLRAPDRSYIVLSNPDWVRENMLFQKINQTLRRHNVNAPKIIAANHSSGLFLLEDFGDNLLLCVLENDPPPEVINQTIEELIRIQSVPRTTENFTLRPYDDCAMNDELSLFPQWFCRTLFAYPMTLPEQKMLENVFNTIIIKILTQPHTFVHRDYHSRNLICLKNGRLGVLDYQDAVWGPISYDIVSLVKDCYITWDDSQIEHWLRSYLEKALAARVIDNNCDYETLCCWVDWIGVQRHLKVLGIFARLWLRDKKPHYTPYFPRICAYIGDVCHRYEELHEFGAWFERNFVPQVAEMDWEQAVIEAKKSKNGDTAL